MTKQIRAGITIDELLALENKRLEVVNGELREKDATMTAASVRHHTIIENLKDILKPYVKQNKLGRVYGDGRSIGPGRISRRVICSRGC